MKRQAEEQIVSTNKIRVSSEDDSLSRTTFPEREKIWFQKQQELSALAAGSPDLFVCFLSAVSLLRRHCSETDEVDPHTKARTKTGLRFAPIRNPETGNWACSLTMPFTAAAAAADSSSSSHSLTKTFWSGPFSRKDVATCWVAFVACKELGLDIPYSSSTPSQLPTRVLRCLGEYILKMTYALESYVNLPYSDEGKMAKRKDDKICNSHLRSCAEDLAVDTFIGVDSPSARNVTRFVKETVGSGYYRGGLSLALQAAMGINGPIVGIATWDDFARVQSSRSRPSAPGQISDAEAARIQGVLGYDFERREILLESLTHRSISIQSKVAVDYERLEFLGDAVLDFLAADYWLGRNQHTSDCGVRRNIQKSTNNAALGALCIELGLYKSLRHHKMDSGILKGEKAVLGVDQKPLYWEDLKISKVYFANLIESIFGAAFQDSGFSLEGPQNMFNTIVRPFYARNFPAV